MSHLPRSPFAWMTPILVGMVLAVAGCGSDSSDDADRINVVTGEAKVTETDNGKPGPSEGDVHVFESPMTFVGSGEDAGVIYGIQTTVSLDDQTEVVQSAFNFKFSDGTISVAGLSEYPKGVNALTKNQEFERVVVGGTGEYSGASGTVTTVLNADGEYEQEILLED